MCESFDNWWQIALAALLVFSLLVMALRLRYVKHGNQDDSLREKTGLQKEKHSAPWWLAGLVLGGSGVMGLTMLALIMLGFYCAGSPGDMEGIIPE